MNPYLLTAIKNRLEKDLADLHLVWRAPAPEPDPVPLATTPRPVQVFIGDLPPKKRRSGTVEPLDESFPCIVIAAVSGHWDGGEDMATVALIGGIYAPEEGDAEGAEMDMAVLFSRIRQSLFPCRKHPLEERYRLTEDTRGRLFPWEKSDMQPRPYMQATLLTHWRMKGLE